MVLCGFKEAILNTKELRVSVMRNDEGPKRIKANAEILVEPKSSTTHFGSLKKKALLPRDRYWTGTRCDEHSPLRGMWGPRQDLALYQVQSVLVLLPGVRKAELETPQARLYDGSFASAVRAGGNGHRKGFGKTAEGPSSKGRDVFTQSLNQA